MTEQPPGWLVLEWSIDNIQSDPPGVRCYRTLEGAIRSFLTNYGWLLVRSKEVSYTEQELENDELDIEERFAEWVS